jgi:hypothetical protein
MEGSFALYSQWFCGDANGAADSLSRDHHLSVAALTHLLVSSCPDQVPPDFSICPLPPDLLLQLETWLLSLPQSMLLP